MAGAPGRLPRLRHLGCDGRIAALSRGLQSEQARAAMSSGPLCWAGPVEMLEVLEGAGELDDRGAAQVGDARAAVWARYVERSWRS
jgi:hypothetical protein